MDLYDPLWCFNLPFVHISYIHYNNANTGCAAQYNIKFSYKMCSSLHRPMIFKMILDY